MRIFVIVFLATLLISGNRTKVWAQTGEFVWQSVGDGLPYKTASAAVFRDKLYVAAYKDLHTAMLYEWDGATWKTLTPLNATHVLVNKLIVYNDELYAVGYFSSLNGLSNTKSIAKWNGNVWSNVGLGLEYAIMPMISDAFVYKDELYISGSFSKVDTLTVNGVARWNGRRWRGLENGLQDSVGGRGIGGSMTEYAGDLYVGGIFTQAGSVAVANIARWNGTEWRAVGEGLSSPIVGFGAVNGLTVFKNALYANGNFQIDETTNFAFWDGLSWKPWTIPLKASGLNQINVWRNPAENAPILFGGGYDITCFGDTLLKKHIFTLKTNDSLACGALELNGIVNFFVEYQDKWYVGGDFTASDADSLKYIAVLGKTTGREGTNFAAPPIFNANGQTVRVRRINGARYWLYNAAGVEMTSGFLLEDGQISIADLPGGIYFLQLTTSKGVYSHRFAK